MSSTDTIPLKKSGLIRRRKVSCKKVPTTELQINVTFNKELTPEDLVKEIASISNPQIIIWYIGSYGLRKTGVHFYKKFLISPILKQNPSSTFWLVDLTAWGAFKSHKCSIEKSHSCCEEIKRFSDFRIKCIKSSEIFKKMITFSEEPIFYYFNKAINRNFISNSSKGFPKKNILVKDLFYENTPLINTLSNHDVSQAYSIFQYLEGCLLVEEILLSNNIQESNHIIFALPNDELKYYWDQENSFCKDIEFLISNRCLKLKINKLNLNITFFSFKYGSHEHERPYNAPGKTFSNNNLTYEDVVGET